MSDPPLSDIDFKNEMAWAGTTLIIAEVCSTMTYMCVGNFQKLSCAVKVHDFMLRINIVASEKLNRASEDVT